ncbi:Rv2175c family DNA-binding protein [Luteimicrobium sp. DT211]|uniref:Rv2175c family DNA-binding protein n=1 Tax=Luteimicrobium sp. DT211 TaxID=3393412 RepID=UPI003CFA3284
MTEQQPEQAPTDATAPASPPDDATWLALPDVADRLGIDVIRVRQLLRERRLVAVRRGERNVLRVPDAFLVEHEGTLQPIPALHGTVVVLDDARFTDDEIVDWLFAPEDTLGGLTPVAALRAGQRAAVRRVAQGLG